MFLESGKQQGQFALDRQYPVEALDVNYQLNYSSINNQPNLELTTRRTALVKFTEIKQDPFTMSVKINSPFEGAGGLYCGLRSSQVNQTGQNQDRRYYQSFEIYKSKEKAPLFHDMKSFVRYMDLTLYVLQEMKSIFWIAG